MYKSKKHFLKNWIRKIKSRKRYKHLKFVQTINEAVGIISSDIDVEKAKTEAITSENFISNI